jgi:hypothetical protein
MAKLLAGRRSGIVRMFPETDKSTMLPNTTPKVNRGRSEVGKKVNTMTERNKVASPTSNPGSDTSPRNKNPRWPAKRKFQQGGSLFAQNAAKWKHKDGGILSFRCGGILKQSGGKLQPATADSTKYYSKKVSDNISEHINSTHVSDKELAAKKVAQSKANLARQANKGKPGYDKNGFPVK